MFDKIFDECFPFRQIIRQTKLIVAVHLLDFLFSEIYLKKVATAGLSSELIVPNDVKPTRRPTREGI